MVTAIPEEWQWPGEPVPPPMFKSIRLLDDYCLRMIVQDMVAEYGANAVALKLADIAEELVL